MSHIILVPLLHAVLIAHPAPQPPGFYFSTAPCKKEWAVEGVQPQKADKLFRYIVVA